MSISTVFSINEDARSSVRALDVEEEIDTFTHFPQALFCLKNDLTLVKSNVLGQRALDAQIISVRNGALRFHSTESNQLVTAVAQRLCLLDREACPDGVCSERLILRGVDGQFRSYTLSRESFDSEILILSIQNDLVLNDCRTRALANAFSLSPAESKILRMMVQGLKPKEIAYEAGVSLNTVRSHLRTLYAKMQVNGYDEALTQAIKLLI